MLWTGPEPDFFLYFNYLVLFYQSFGRVAKVRGSLAGVGGNKCLSNYSVSISFYFFAAFLSELRRSARAWQRPGCSSYLSSTLSVFSLFFAAFSSAFGRVAKVRGSLARVWR